jgi:uncharacterized protein
VLYDLAFVLMDLLHYARHDAANEVLNRYLSVTPAENLDALTTLPLLMSIRAAIRAHVLPARAGRANSDSAAKDARAYFDLAKQLIHPHPPTLVAVGGLSGTGKSAMARALAPYALPQPGAIILRSDVVRKQLFEVAPEQKLPETAYRPQISNEVYDVLSQQVDRVLSQGHSAMADAVFARESERAAIMHIARRAHVRFVGTFLVADLRIRQERIARRTADASDATTEIAELQEQYHVGAVDWAVVDASGTPEETLSKCLKLAALNPATK